MAVTAATYGVGPELLLAESRGRGPRPPEQAREPKKIAVFIAVVLADCEYIQLARHVGLHKDTIASHCAEIRALSEDDRRERHIEVLIAAAAVRLQLAPAQLPLDRAERIVRVRELERHMNQAFAAARLRRTDEAPPSSAPSSVSELDHGNVIELPRKGLSA